jgi:hypothetical protein
MAHLSDSATQRAAEPLILAGVSAKLAVPLAPKSLKLPGGSRVDVDGVNEEEDVFVEIFAHQGRLRGGQVHKVARDALKLVTLARAREGARLVIAFGDADAASCVTGASWLSEALNTWCVEVIVADLDESVREGLREAQVRQVMVNVEAAADAEAEPDELV